MKIRIQPSDSTVMLMNFLSVTCFKRLLFGVLAFLTIGSLYGCASPRSGVDPIIEPLASVGPGDTIVDVPDETTTASTLSATGPVIEARCDFNSELGTTVKTLVNDLTKQKIPYTLGEESIGEWRDCSGVFLRFSSALAQSCPMLESRLAASAGVKKYNPDTNNMVKGVEARGERSTRTIAKWYNAQGGFTPVTYAAPHNKDLGATGRDIAQLEGIRDLIKVGSVLWFSRHKPQRGDDIQSLFEKHINHMGVVTNVIFDDDGVLKRYEMFHGHGKRGNPAKSTKQHFWEWPSEYNNHERYPPLGFWTQYLVGISPVFAGQTDEVITLTAN